MSNCHLCIEELQNEPLTKIIPKMSDNDSRVSPGTEGMVTKNIYPEPCFKEAWHSL